MPLTQKAPRILIVDPTAEVAAWQIGLEDQPQLEVKHVSGKVATPQMVLSFSPDLILLHASLAVPPVQRFLADLQSLKIETPVVMVGANGERPAIEANYPHIIGWISFPINPADLIMIAVQNAKLYEDTRHFSRNLQLVNEVSWLVSSSLDVEQIPHLLLNQTARLVGAECGSLALINEGKNGVIFQVAYDGQGQELKGLKDFLMPLGKGIVGLVAQTGQPVVANEARSHPAWSPLPDQITGFTTKKLVAVPLINEGEILGVIELLNKKEGD